MKGLNLLCALLLSCSTAMAGNVSEQASGSATNDNMLFNHWSVGLDVGTPGIGASVATTCTDYLQIRAGFAIFPKITYTRNLTLKDNQGNTPPPALGLPQEVEVQGKAKMAHGMVLFSVYPFRSSKVPVAFTAGAYFGTSDVITLKNTQPFTPDQISKIEQGNFGLGLNNYHLPFKNGQSTMHLNVNGFKPFLGFSFGRAVPAQKRVSCMLDLGILLWNTPKVYDINDRKLTEDDFGDDGGKVIRIATKFKVYPMLNFRICGRFL